MTELPISRPVALRAVLYGVLLSLGLVVAFPRFHSGPCRGGHHNESAAIATLRNIHSAQGEFRAMAFVDEDGDGVGEFGTLQELSAAVAPRGWEAPADAEVIESTSSEVATIESDSAPDSEPGAANSSPAPC